MFNNGCGCGCDILILLLLLSCCGGHDCGCKRGIDCQDILLLYIVMCCCGCGKDKCCC